jgi:drug/metabolite transporter (DMT)-like permease
VKPWILIIAAGVIFGVGGPGTKWLIEQGLDPIFLTGIVFSIAALVSLGFHRRSGGLPARGWRQAMVLGVLSGSGPAIFFNLGFQRLPASVTTLLIATGPVFTAITAHFVTAGDRFTALKAGGFTLSIAGVGLLGANSSGATSLLGIVLTLSGAALSGVSLPFVKTLSTVYRPATTLGPLMLGAGAMGLLAIGFSGSWESPEPSEWALIVALGVTLAVAFFTILAANELAPPSQVSLFAYVIPVVGVVLGVLVLNEPFGWRLVAGGVLILLGVTAVGRENRARKKAAVGSLPEL